MSPFVGGEGEARGTPKGYGNVLKVSEVTVEVVTEEGRRVKGGRGSCGCEKK